MKLAIVILNWNGVKLLKKFLKPLVTYTNTENEIYVIDNKSTDNSIDYIKSNFPTIKTIKNNGNTTIIISIKISSIANIIFILLN